MQQFVLFLGWCLNLKRFAKVIDLTKEISVFQTEWCGFYTGSVGKWGSTGKPLRTGLSRYVCCIL